MQRRHGHTSEHALAAHPSCVSRASPPPSAAQLCGSCRSPAVGCARCSAKTPFLAAGRQSRAAAVAAAEPPGIGSPGSRCARCGAFTGPPAVSTLCWPRPERQQRRERELGRRRRLTGSPAPCDPLQSNRRWMLSLLADASGLGPSVTEREKVGSLWWAPGLLTIRISGFLSAPESASLHTAFTAGLP